MSPTLACSRTALMLLVCMLAMYIHFVPSFVAWEGGECYGVVVLLWGCVTEGLLHKGNLSLKSEERGKMQHV